jgi:two-component system, chemotaxis family, protein-glutamate methylesterase/glutaminase
VVTTISAPHRAVGRLAERLDRLAAVDVVEAADGDVVMPGRVYIAPEGRHLSLTGTNAGGNVLVLLTDGPTQNSCRSIRWRRSSSAGSQPVAAASD